MYKEPTERENQPPEPFAALVLADEELLFDLTKILVNIDPIEDNRVGSAELSTTGFWPHPIFDNESTSIRGSSAKEETGAPRFSVKTHINLDDSYTNRDHMGYFSKQKIDNIAALIECQIPDYRISVSTRRGRVSISIVGEGSKVRIKFGYPSFDTRQLEGRRMDEITKEIIHPEGRYHEEFEGLHPQHFVNPEPLVSETRNTDIQLELHGMRSGDIDEFLASITSGVPLVSAASFEKHLDFYAEAYSALINAICVAENVLPPSQKVHLGSNLV